MIIPGMKRLPMMTYAQARIQIVDTEKVRFIHENH